MIDVRFVKLNGQFLCLAAAQVLGVVRLGE